MNLDPVSLFKALSEELRLRILRVLDIAGFSVAELTDIFNAPQSTISRHLARLRDAELVEARRQGALVFYSKGAAWDAGLASLMERASAEAPWNEADRAAAHRILERRRRQSQSYFDAMARRYSEIVEPGGSWRALAGALAMGFEGKIVADIGAGEGEIALRLARSARRVHAIDHSAEMVRFLREKAAAWPNVSVEEGDLESLPLEDGCCDVAIVSQVLHHCPRPRVALGEAYRVLRPGGRLIVLDLEEHQEEWARERLADHWLGFNRGELLRWLREAGFESASDFADPQPESAIRTIVITGLKPMREAFGGIQAKSIRKERHR
ncbi:MAG: putative S-adenosylmethionine-dependent methyltransferase [candidate division BRC1 bacterium ADurb.BinA364]|nr:MAG: putative S-adenosylmethionine-dependent methyltransferase [candidate division BRC1 bacterium ADurb.BinA364]